MEGVWLEVLQRQLATCGLVGDLEPAGAKAIRHLMLPPCFPPIILVVILAILRLSIQSGRHCRHSEQTKWLITPSDAVRRGQ